MKSAKKLLLGAALMCAISTLATPAAHATPLIVSGIYSDLKYNAEGGDLLGMDMLIFAREAKGDGAWSAFVQIAEGGSPYNAVVPLSVTGSHLEFTLPAGSALGELHFVGTLTSNGLRLRSSAGQDVHLRRGKSY